MFVEERRIRSTGPVERFDRLSFALRALALLKPPQTRVAVYTCRSEIRIEQGRDLESGPEARWALVGIPPDASREHIAVALAGLADALHVPYVLDALMGAGQNDA